MDGYDATIAAAPEARVSRVEYRYVWTAALVVMAATCLPYLICWYATPEGAVFPGVLFNADDHGVYFAWMRQARDGHFLFRNLFTNEPQTGRYVHLYFWALGTLARWTGLTIPLAYHAGRVAMGILTLVLAYRFGAFFTADRFARRIIFWTTALSGGLGWTQWQDRVNFSTPVDAWQPEALTFQSLYTNGLFAVSLALILGTVNSLLAAETTGKLRWAVWGGVCALLLANIHTYDILTLAAIWLVYLAAAGVMDPRKARLRLAAAGTAALVSLPGVGYQLYYFATESTFRSRVEVPTLSPAFHLYLLGYGLLIPFAGLGLAMLFKSRAPASWSRSLLLPVWLVVGFALPYLPVAFQRKLVMGLHFPIAVLAGLGIAWLAARLARSGSALGRRLLAGACVAITAVTPLLFVGRDLKLAILDNMTSTGVHPVWWPAEDFAAMNWMSQHLPGDAVIFCRPTRGVFLPSTTGRRVWAGHWGETPEFARKERQAGRVYAGLEPAAAGVAAAGATVLFFGSGERALSEDARSKRRPGFQPGSGLVEVHRSGDARVYELRPGRGGGEVVD